MTNKDILIKMLLLMSWMTPTWVSSAPRQPRLSLAEPMPSYFYNNIDVLGQTANAVRRTAARVITMDACVKFHMFEYDRAHAAQSGQALMLEDHGHPGTYSFGYDVSDDATGNIQYRNEERYPNGTVVGSYGYLDPRGRPQRYRYIADERGYRVMRDRPRPVMPASNPNAIFNDQEEITWKRKKPNRRVMNLGLRNNKFLPFPGKYVLQ